MLKPLVHIALFMAWAFVPLHQAVTEITPPIIEEAIAEGARERRPWAWNKKTDRKSAPGSYATGCYGVRMTTPYSRIVLASRWAKQHYKPFSAADVTATMAAPELEILAQPVTLKSAVVYDAEAVVVAPKGAKDLSQVIQPTSSVEFDTILQNLMGAKFDGKGIVARFPMSVLKKGNEVRIVRGGMPECKYGLDPKKVK